MEDKITKKQEIHPENQLISKTETKKQIPGVYITPPKKFSDEEIQDRVKQHHDNLFSLNQITEGGRHGLTRPWDLSEFFNEFSLS